ncbi:MAG: hypothetical protein DWP98_11940 [Bacteroidetes bacterium]|nr:MAG: hypothetical protein DWP98_11940 [Bacteroidota bacterium]MBL1144241.1 hypothetical protein [Bacteroidota bacterium]MCB0802595.1 hypothetical protein [Flavobacteriales bacterium]NOG57037.1 hypothetical protein [Bacteroidota bacterium]
MKAGFKFDAIKVCDNLLIDGHHRYIASIIADVSIESFPSTKNHSQITYNWSDVILKTNEYDSPTDIKYHNFNDAKRNGTTIEEVKRILSN